MEGYRVLEIKQSVFENNDREADKLREQLKRGLDAVERMAEGNE